MRIHRAEVFERGGICTLSFPAILFCRRCLAARCCDSRASKPNSAYEHWHACECVTQGLCVDGCLPSTHHSSAKPGLSASPLQTVITTHFQEIFDLDLLRLPRVSDGIGFVPPPSPPSIKFYQMDVVVDKKQIRSEGGGEGVDGDAGVVEELEVVTPLFRLVPGRAAKSYGIACARLAGVPEGVLKRAGAVTTALESGVPVPLPSLPSGDAAASFHRMFRAMESQAFCADAIMSVEDWGAASPAQLRVLLQFFVSAAT